MGLIKSVDGGKTWRAVGLKVGADFHILAAGYETNVVYVANRVPTSRMSETGVHYTRNDGVAWQRAALQGLGGPMHQLAVHPTDPKQLAAGTDTGLYVSRDWGDNFERIGAPAFVLAVAFDLDGAHLWSSSYVADKPVLAKIRLGVRAIEWQTEALAPYVTRVNGGLGAIRDGLKVIDANLAGLLAAVSRQATRGRP